MMDRRQHTASTNAKIDNVRDTAVIFVISVISASAAGQFFFGIVAAARLSISRPNAVFAISSQ